MGGGGEGGGALIRALPKPSRPDIFFIYHLFHFTTLFYHFILTSLVHGSDGDNETAEVSRGWSLIRDLTEPFRPHILSVLRFLQCLWARWGEIITLGGGVVGGGGV